MSRIGIRLLILLLSVVLFTQTSAVAQKVGDWVVVKNSTQIKLENRVISKVEPGIDLRVQGIRQGWLWVDYEGAGWIPSNDVLSLSEAVKHFTKAIGDATTDPKLYEARAHAYDRLLKHDLAIFDYNEAIRLDPKNASAFGNRGLALAGKGEYAKAIKDFDQALKLNPKDATIYNSRGVAWENQNKLDKALADYTQAIKLNPTYTYALCNRGIVLQALKHHEKAAADLTAAIKLNPRDADSYFSRATVWFDLQEYAKADADFSQTIKLNPLDGEAFFERGTVRWLLGRPDDAISDFNEAIKIYPIFPEAYLNRGRLYARKSQYNQAIADLDKAVKMVPKSTIAYFTRGAVYSQMGKPKEAIADLKKAIELDDKADRAFNSLAWIQATCPDKNNRNGKEAVENATKACEQTKWKNPSFIDTLAAALAESGDFDQAIKRIEQAIQLVPEDARADFQTRLKIYQDKKPFRAEK